MMTAKLTVACRILVATLLLGTLQSACGGRASGSAEAVGGSGNSAGNGQSGGAVAGAGSYQDRCVDGLHGGECTAAFIRYWHDAATNTCRAFTWGGCGQGGNNYETLAQCEASCGSTSTTSCNVASDCAVSDAICCTFCDGAEWSNQFVAYNKAYAAQYPCNLGVKELPAGDPSTNPGPGANIGCQCPALQPGQGTKKYFVPDCVQGTCAVADLRKSPLTACTTDADCRLRNGTSCCEGCLDENQYVAVRNDGSFEQAMCGDPRPACSHCASLYPPEAVAICGETGHCEVAYRGPSGP